MVGIECGIKIRAKSMFGIGIRNSAEVRNPEIRAGLLNPNLLSPRPGSELIKSEIAIKVKIYVGQVGRIIQSSRRLETFGTQCGQEARADTELRFIINLSIEISDCPSYLTSTGGAGIEGEGQRNKSSADQKDRAVATTIEVGCEWSSSSRWH
ncbi:hypothetical protein EVAR_48765_1 [Eumeta japonica]|uniref:Uncharacterized protein n=1 Tax=Eumeta variegata TaxID=151549 RepID=A0A4C1Y1J6_EUMVA|nr:hypothetical protein EVAR_48765_1 [Eumeta japonica]